MSEVFQVIGKPTPRLDGPDKVSGRTIYTGDVSPAGLLHAKILRSPYAHARILSIDTSRATALPGVRAVVTAADVPKEHIDPAVRAHVVFADREVIFHAQPVAAVAADSLDIAEEAIALIEVVYEELPPVLDCEAAMEDDSPLARLYMAGEESGEDREAHTTIDVGPQAGESKTKQTNVANRLQFKRGDIERGFAEADVVVEGKFEAAMVHQAPLEPQVAVAVYDAYDRLTIWTGTQAQFHQREEIAHILNLPICNVRVISAEMGGGFGGKVAPIVHPVAGLLSMKTRRPVKISLTRKEELQCGVPAQRTITWAKIGAKRDGTLTTIQTRIVMDSGAFATGYGLAAVMVAANYRYEHLVVDSIRVITNKVSTGAYRAPGVPEVIFAVEQLVDEIARKLGLDQLELRKRNAVREGDLMPNGKPWPRIGLIESIEALEQSELWKNRRQTVNGKTRGIGVAVGGWLGGFQPCSSLVRLNENGTITVVMGSNDISGTNTTFALIAAEVLGVPLEMVEAYTADTDTAPFAGMVTGSKSIYSFGPSVKAAAEDARRQILNIASAELHAAPENLELTNGEVIDRESGKSVSFVRVGGLSMSNGARYAPVLGRGGEVVREVAPGFTAQAVEVEIDDATGELRILKVAAVQDVGKALNPTAVFGQLEGGVVQSLGMGMTEEMLYDEKGRMRNPTFLDYQLLTSLDVPHIESILVEVPSPEGPYGARIVGEPPIIAASTALANAITDATGVRLREAPMKPERVWRAIRAGVREPVAVG